MTTSFRGSTSSNAFLSSCELWIAGLLVGPPYSGHLEGESLMREPWGFLLGPPGIDVFLGAQVAWATHRSFARGRHFSPSRGRVSEPPSLATGRGGQGVLRHRQPRASFRSKPRRAFEQRNCLSSVFSLSLCRPHCDQSTSRRIAAGRLSREKPEVFSLVKETGDFYVPTLCVFYHTD